MKDFDLNKIGKEMPYKAPGDQFFEEFTDELLAKVTPKPRKIYTLRRILTPVASVAAALALVLIFAIEHQEQSQWNDGYLSENLDESLDAFLSELSDAELEYLASESSYNNDFYANLPLNN